MRVTILTFGSQGDVQPFVALAQGLKGAGYAVRLAAHPIFERFVLEHGLDFAPLAGDPHDWMRSQVKIELNRYKPRGLSEARRFVARYRPIMRAMLDDSVEACRDADAVIYAHGALAGFHIAKSMGVPGIFAVLQPWSRTRSFPSILFPPGTGFGPAFNWLSHLAGEQIIWQPWRKTINAWLEERLGQPPLPLTGPYGRMLYERVPLLYGYSARIAPKAKDWPGWSHLTGFWFLEGQAKWQPPAALTDFLGAGPAPVCIGFGSNIPGREPAEVTELILSALARTGQRAVLLSGWANLGRRDLPGDVFKLDAAPHDWLFARMAAVVHHGGAGTSAAGIRAGVPSVTVPFFFDQFFWGHRLYKLGVGPAPISQKDFSAARLAQALRATAEPGMRQHAGRLGSDIRAEDGVLCAVKVVNGYLQPHHQDRRKRGKSLSRSGGQD